MPVTPVATVDQVPPGQVIEVAVGEKTFALCNVDGRFYAVDGVCPHRYGPLSQGGLEGDQVICPWHCWRFSVRTGEFDFNPDVKVATYEVVVDGDRIAIRTED